MPNSKARGAPEVRRAAFEPGVGRRSSLAGVQSLEARRVLSPPTVPGAGRHESGGDLATISWERQPTTCG